MPEIARMRIIPDRLTKSFFPIFRAAITLVEITLGLAIAAMVVSVGVRAYANGQENERVHALNQELATVKSIVDARYGPSGDYSTLSAANVANGLPPTWAQTSTAGYTATPISNPFKGGVYVAPYNSQYQIGADLISKGACPRIVNIFSDSKDLTGIVIYDTSSQNQIGSFDVAKDGKPTAAAVSTTCSDAALATAHLVWNFGAASAQSGGSGSSGGSGDGSDQSSSGDDGSSEAPPTLAQLCTLPQYAQARLHSGQVQQMCRDYNNAGGAGCTTNEGQNSCP